MLPELQMGEPPGARGFIDPGWAHIQILSGSLGREKACCWDGCGGGIGHLHRPYEPEKRLLSSSQAEGIAPKTRISRGFAENSPKIGPHWEALIAAIALEACHDTSPLPCDRVAGCDVRNGPV